MTTMGASATNSGDEKNSEAAGIFRHALMREIIFVQVGTVAHAMGTHDPSRSFFCR
jgi:hypothetical protein